MGLDKLRDTARKTYLRARAVDRLVHSAEFGEAYTRSSSFQRDLMTGHVDFSRIGYLRNMVDGLNHTVLEDKTYAEIRDLAQKLAIPHYSRMSKDDLIRAVSRAYDEKINEALKDLP